MFDMTNEPSGPGDEPCEEIRLLHEVIDICYTKIGHECTMMAAQFNFLNTLRAAMRGERAAQSLAGQLALASVFLMLRGGGTTDVEAAKSELIDELSKIGKARH